MMEVDTVYDGPEASRVQLDQGWAASVNDWQVGVISSAASYISTKTVDKPVGKLFSYPVMQALQSIH
jgi:hypothetical protein